ncbi:MAG: hypothetical protein ACX94C_07730 [Phycisphaerales bacterium]
MIQQLEIPLPLGGVSDQWSAHYQEPFTSAGMENMRGYDPVSMRRRLAQRAGTAKFVDAVVGASFIQDVISINKDVRLATYTARTGGPLVEWSTTTPAMSYTRDLAITPGGDVWVISGTNRIVKYNPAGTKVLEVQLPLTFENESAKQIAIGADAAVFVCTETSNDRYAGKVFRYEADPLNADQMTLVWTYNAQARVPSIVHNAGVLYLIANKSDVAELRALGDLPADSPVVNWSRPIPRPSTHVTVNAGGDVLVASEPREGRDDVVLGDFCGVKTEDWNPIDLGSDLRSWHKASDLAEFTNLQEVDFWFDASGNSRNIRAASEGEGPVGGGGSRATYGGKFVENGICGLPAVRFDGTENADGLYPGMTSDEGAGALIPPGNTPSFITMIFKCRNPGADPNDVGDYGKIIERGGQPYFTVWQNVTGLFYHAEFSEPTILDDTGSGGSLEAASDKRAGGMSVANDGDIAILTIAFDPQGDDEGSFFRLNGASGGSYTPDGQFKVQNFANPDFNRIGYTVWGDEFPNFDLCEIVSVEQNYQWPSDYDDSSGAPVSGAPSSGAGVSDIEKVEGYLAHRYGVQSILDASHPYKGTAPGGPSGGSSGSSGGGASYADVLRSPDGIVSKYAAAGGALIWAIDGAGLGYSVVCDDEDGVYAMGPTDTLESGESSSLSGTAPDTATVRKLVDNGFSVSEDETSGGSAWSYEGPEEPLAKGARMAVDSEKNLYVPMQDADSTPTLLKFTLDGTLEWSWNSPQITTGLAAAIDTIETDFGDDTIGEPEFLYLATDSGTTASDKPTLYKLRLVDVSVAVGAPRENVHLAVCEGNIRRLIPGGSPEVETVTNGASALNSGSRIVSSVLSAGQVFYIDGENRKVYDPDTNTVSDWESTGAGTIPTRPKLICDWRGRVVLARCEGKSRTLYMSEQGNPFGWDFYPPVISATMAVSLDVPTTSDTGNIPDVVNALVPYSDEILIIGGDHTIWAINGDPTAGVLGAARGTFPSGQLQLISDSVGMAYGRPWCKDPSGVLYFFGSRGGVYRMVPGSRPERISDNIDKRIEDLDLNYFTMRMVWNDRDKGLHLYVVPIDVVPPESGGSSGGGSGGSSGGSSGASSGGSSGASSGASSGGSSGPASGGSSSPGSGSSSGGSSGGGSSGGSAGSSGGSSGGSDGSAGSGGSSGDGSDGSSGGSSSGGGGGGQPGGTDVSGPDPIDTPESPTSSAQANEAIQHWFWTPYGGPMGSWWADRFHSEDLDPTAVTVADGDEPDDRVVLIGSADGYVRYIDPDGKNDDGSAICATSLFGPIMPKSVHQRGRFSGFRVVLGSDQDGAEMRLFASDVADDIGDAKDLKTLAAGDNGAWRRRVRGRAVFLQIFNDTLNERFAVEAVGCEFTPGGRVR